MVAQKRDAPRPATIVDGADSAAEASRGRALAPGSEARPAVASVDGVHVKRKRGRTESVSRAMRCVSYPTQSAP
ncbi:hypothetical protein CMI37_21405 [Candidatus Pacearchaeota archaeon]|nr:hypothetical protein [Candidatus Pacearchaeota archaeon]